MWQNNGTTAHQAIPRLHFHVAATLPGGGTNFDDVPELSVTETDQIAARILGAAPPIEEPDQNHADHAFGDVRRMISHPESCGKRSEPRRSDAY